MSIKKLIIGTANFGQEYNGLKVDEKEVDKILDYARETGIDILDCATAYNWQWPNDFQIINKITGIENQRVGSYATLIHHAEEVPVVWPVLWELKFGTIRTSARIMKIGISIYNHKEITCLPYDVIQLPYKSLNSILPELKARGIEIHARKVFADKCFEAALSDKLVDKVVIGVDSLQQLKEDIKIAEGIK